MMNKNTSMSSIYNFFQDLLTNKIPVDKGPLEGIADPYKEIDQNNRKNYEDLLSSTEEEKILKGKIKNKFNYYHKGVLYLDYKFNY